MTEWLRLPQIQALEAELHPMSGAGHLASALMPGVLSANGVAIAGLDGYLFISDGVNKWERQYLGQLPPPQVWMDTWRMRLEARQTEAAARGVTLVNLVIPEKQVTHPEYRWPEPYPDAQQRPLKLLMAQLDTPVHLIYPETELVAAKACGPVSRRHDSHWTTFGCGIVVAKLLEALSATVNFADLPLAVQKRHATMDLSAHFFTQGAEEDYLAAVPLGEVLDEDVLPELRVPGRKTGSTYRVRNPGAPDPRRVVLFADSYGYDAGLTAMLSAVFADVTYLWSKNIVWDLVAARQADIVIWEGAERFMTTYPAV